MLRETIFPQHNWYLLGVKTNVSHTHNRDFWYLLGGEGSFKIHDAYDNHCQFYMGVPLGLQFEL